MKPCTPTSPTTHSSHFWPVSPHPPSINLNVVLVVSNYVVMKRKCINYKKSMRSTHFYVYRYFPAVVNVKYIEPVIFSKKYLFYSCRNRNVIVYLFIIIWLNITVPKDIHVFFILVTKGTNTIFYNFPFFQPMIINQNVIQKSI